VVELSAGQMVEDVRLAVEGRCPVALPRPDGRHGPDPDEVVAALRALEHARGRREVMRPYPATHRRPRPVIYQHRSADRPLHALLPGLRARDHPPLLAEVLDELELAPRTIAVARSAAAVFAYDYLALDFVEAPHGRAPAVATGVRRVRPDAFVLTYQGDGDLAAIGTAEIVHAAAAGS
jgi:hypothetical protein